MATLRRLSESDVKTVFACVHNNRVPPPSLCFRIVVVGPNGMKLSPPFYEYEDGLYILLRPLKKKGSRNEASKYSSPADDPRVPSKLKSFVMLETPPETCPWCLSGPQFPIPTAIQQRYCYPKGDSSYSGTKGGALWTTYLDNGKEDLEYRLLHVYFSPKRAGTSGMSTVYSDVSPSLSKSRESLFLMNDRSCSPLPYDEMLLPSITTVTNQRNSRTRTDTVIESRKEKTKEAIHTIQHSPCRKRIQNQQVRTRKTLTVTSIAKTECDSTRKRRGRVTRSNRKDMFPQSTGKSSHSSSPSSTSKKKAKYSTTQHGNDPLPSLPELPPPTVHHSCAYPYSSSSSQNWPPSTMTSTGPRLSSIDPTSYSYSNTYSYYPTNHYKNDWMKTNATYGMYPSDEFGSYSHPYPRHDVLTSHKMKEEVSMEPLPFSMFQENQSQEELMDDTKVQNHSSWNDSNVSGPYSHERQLPSLDSMSFPVSPTIPSVVRKSVTFTPPESKHIHSPISIPRTLKHHSKWEEGKDILEWKEKKLESDFLFWNWSSLSSSSSSSFSVTTCNVYEYPLQEINHSSKNGSNHEEEEITKKESKKRMTRSVDDATTMQLPCLYQDTSITSPTVTTSPTTIAPSMQSTHSKLATKLERKLRQVKKSIWEDIQSCAVQQEGERDDLKRIFFQWVDTLSVEPSPQSK